MNDNKLSFTVSAGHAEYMIPMVENVEQSLVVSSIQDVTVEVLRGMLSGDLSDVGWEDATIDDSIVTVGDEDYDAMFETFVHWYGTREEVEGWLKQLMEDVMGGPYGADDDTFDYWPSGVRYCMQVAKHVSGDWPERVAKVAREAIDLRRPEFKDELLNACWLA
jgi:hypothetical protein